MAELETLIIYAATMRLVLVGSLNRESFIGESQLRAFKRLANIMPNKMRDILFSILSAWIVLKREDSYGSMPVMNEVPRLHPLFYYTAEIQDMFYTVNDTFVKMGVKTISQEELTQGLLEDSKDETKINELTIKLNKNLSQKDRLATTAEVEDLKAKMNLRAQRRKEKSYTRSTEFEIEYTELESLSTNPVREFDNKSVREKLLQTVKPQAQIVLVLLSSIGIKVLYNDLARCATPFTRQFNDFYNHRMDMLSTLDMIINYREIVEAKGHKKEVQPSVRLQKELARTMELYKKALEQEESVVEDENSENESQWKTVQRTSRKKKTVPSSIYFEPEAPEGEDFQTFPEIMAKFNEIWANAAAADYHRYVEERKSFSVLKRVE